MIPTTTSTSTMMNVLYSSTSFLLLLLIGLLIVNFNISVISSGFCQDRIRRWNLSEDDDEDEEGYEHDQLEPQQGESRPVFSSSSTFSLAQSMSTSRLPHEPLDRQRLSSDRRRNYASTHNISQRIRSTSSQQQQQHDGEGDGNGDDGRHHQLATHTQSTATITTTRDRELEETYEIIYRNISRRYLEGEDVKSWMWLMGALLISIVCIRVELLLFDSLTTSSEYVDEGTTNTTNVTNVTTIDKPIYSNITNIITNISASSNTTANESYPVF
mmetsp:Transcript_44648/g.108290  ORF Transcript_44648/g.108290 Transcript_44648/m.108290 type:complete len:272 (-) Transcript_44648:190-1005(-)